MLVAVSSGHVTHLPGVPWRSRALYLLRPHAPASLHRPHRTEVDAGSGRKPGPSPAGGAAAARRLDLQGLRGVAVLLVALNHANVPFLKGGYIGVDVFFVLSGYFITGILLREGFGRDDAGLGGISIRGFYARRARRILPAACLTLLVTSIAVYVVYDLMRDNFLQTKVVLDDALAASLFFANWHFVANATNYFAQATTTLPSPFQHFWSLSVEEQFYVVWPSLMAGTFFLCRRRARAAAARGDDDPERHRRNATRILAVLILGGCAASLYWSIHATAQSPQAAYFSTFTRVWELGCGAGIALLAARTRALPRLPRTLLSWAGVAMIGFAAVRYSSSTSFPGYAALLPVLGSGLLIIGGRDGTRIGADKLLAVRPLTYVGDRSYTFYLWHYPALVLVWAAVGHVLPVVDNLGLLAGAFLLSTITYGLYENPLRFSRWLRGWRTAAMVPISIGASVLAVLIPISAFEASLAQDAVAATHAHVASLAPAAGQLSPTNLWASKPIPKVAVAVDSAQLHAKLPRAIVPSMQQLQKENSYIGYDMPRDCQPGFGPGTTSKICHLGDSSSSKVVAVIGDSHAGMWMPALIADARQQHFAVVPLNKPGCVLDAIHKNLKGWPCANWYRWALAQDRKLHPLATIVAFQLTPAMEQRRSATTGALQSVLAQVRSGVLLADPPGQDQQPSACISQTGANLGQCAAHVPSGYVPLMHSLSAMLTRTHHPGIPTMQWFCASGVCPMVIDNTLTTRDESHLTMQYSTDLAPLMGDVLKPILARLERSAS
jgi:peptidoglycan/LPS O-acetylase OafA/YrhL